METRDFIIQCGITYQPFVIGLNLLQEKYAPGKIYIATTYPAVSAIRTLMSEYFPNIEYIIEGCFVSGKGCYSDQNEYTRIIKNFEQEAINPVCLIASGTNWMTYLFSKLLLEAECYTIRTHKDFQQKSFTPEQDRFSADSNGRLVKVCENEKISELVLLKNDEDSRRLSINGKTVCFLGQKITFAQQEAAMFAYFLHIGGELDIRDNHKEEFNRFCENDAQYDSYRVMLDDDDDTSFADRFKQNVSKINGTLKTCDKIIQNHLKIIREDSFYYRFSTAFYKLMS